jgi:tetratricopeptide (TPR) repeat protein
MERAPADVKFGKSYIDAFANAQYIPGAPQSVRWIAPDAIKYDVNDRVETRDANAAESSLVSRATIKDKLGMHTIPVVDPNTGETILGVNVFIAYNEESAIEAYAAYARKNRMKIDEAVHRMTVERDRAEQVSRKLIERLALLKTNYDHVDLQRGSDLFDLEQEYDEMKGTMSGNKDSLGKTALANKEVQDRLRSEIAKVGDDIVALTADLRARQATLEGEITQIKATIASRSSALRSKKEALQAQLAMARGNMTEARKDAKEAQEEWKDQLTLAASDIASLKKDKRYSEEKRQIQDAIAKNNRALKQSEQKRILVTDQLARETTFVPINSQPSGPVPAENLSAAAYAAEAAAAEKRTRDVAHQLANIDSDWTSSRGDVDMTPSPSHTPEDKMVYLVIRHNNNKQDVYDDMYYDTADRAAYTYALLVLAAAQQYAQALSDIDRSASTVATVTAAPVVVDMTPGIMFEMLYDVFPTDSKMRERLAPFRRQLTEDTATWMDLVLNLYTTLPELCSSGRVISVTLDAESQVADTSQTGYRILTVAERSPGENFVTIPALIPDNGTQNDADDIASIAILSMRIVKYLAPIANAENNDVYKVASAVVKMVERPAASYGSQDLLAALRSPLSQATFTAYNNNDKHESNDVTDVAKINNARIVLMEILANGMVTAPEPLSKIVDGTHAWLDERDNYQVIETTGIYPPS